MYSRNAVTLTSLDVLWHFPRSWSWGECGLWVMHPDHQFDTSEKYINRSGCFYLRFEICERLVILQGKEKASLNIMTSQLVNELKLDWKRCYTRLNLCLLISKAEFSNLGKDWKWITIILSLLNTSRNITCPSMSGEYIFNLRLRSLQ